MNVDLTDHVALVTGASSGIGSAVARMLARRGAKVAMCARREDRLRALADQIVSETPEATVWTQTCDLRSTDAIVDLFEALHQSLGPVDVLINNAGLGKPAPLSTPGENRRSYQGWAEMLDVNVMALSVCTAEAVAQMQAADKPGHVVHISSMAGYRIPKEGGFYGATKHAVRALTEGLRRELQQQGSPIRVSAISPGVVQTEFGGVFFGDQDRADEMYAGMKPLSAEDIAAAVEFALTAPPHMQVHDVLLRPLAQPD
ncbi:MAG: SDR family NAD(P)-dependent oxidoreductase [Myxococcota bacterium]